MTKSSGYVTGCLEQRKFVVHLFDSSIIYYYPVGDMITGTKAGDGQYARTDYTGVCETDDIDSLSLGSLDGLESYTFFVCLCLNRRRKA